MIQRKNQRLNSSILIIFYSRTSVIREILHLTKCCRNEVLRILLSMEDVLPWLDHMRAMQQSYEEAARIRNSSSYTFYRTSGNANLFATFRCRSVAAIDCKIGILAGLFNFIWPGICSCSAGTSIAMHATIPLRGIEEEYLFDETECDIGACSIRLSAAAVDDEFLHIHPDQQDEAAAAVVAVAAVAVAVASPHPQLVDRMAASR
ncbi:hypothetical protein Q3G72_010782 [Acer saccharum]|nr:hypothetical protein Q3G72_010782 [Acer saccharum]